eukprot:1500222-Pyramimonas_sp.AAC.1
MRDARAGPSGNCSTRVRQGRTGRSAADSPAGAARTSPRESSEASSASILEQGPRARPQRRLRRTNRNPLP